MAENRLRTPVGVGLRARPDVRFRCTRSAPKIYITAVGTDAHIRPHGRDFVTHRNHFYTAIIHETDGCGHPSLRLDAGFLVMPFKLNNPKYHSLHRKLRRATSRYPWEAFSFSILNMNILRPTMIWICSLLETAESNRKNNSSEK
jgi:hypothetical protein